MSVLKYTLIVRHPDTDQPVGLLAGSSVPEWAQDLVHADDLTEASVAQVEVEQPAEVEAPVVEAEAPAEKPSMDWTAAQIKAYAGERSIDLGGASTKADMLAAIGA